MLYRTSGNVMGVFMQTFSKYLFKFRTPPTMGLTNYCSQLNMEMNYDCPSELPLFNIQEKDFKDCFLCESTNQIRKCELCVYMKKLVKKLGEFKYAKISKLSD